MRPPRSERRTRGRGKKRSERRLTIRQRKTLKGVAAGKPVLQAALAAGYSEASAHSVPYRNGNLRAEVASLLAAAGLDDRSLMAELKTLVRAREIKFFAHEGKVTDTRRVVSLDAKAKGLDMSFKLRGLYPTRQDASGNGADGPPAINFFIENPATGTMTRLQLVNVTIEQRAP